MNRRHCVEGPSLMESMRQEIRQFVIASDDLLFCGVNADQLSKAERDAIHHYVSLIAAKFPAVPPG